MQQGSSEERITSANSSPRMPHKSTTLFGRWTKRGTKVEPHPLNHASSADNEMQSSLNTTSTNAVAASATGSGMEQHDMSFAKCSPDKKSPAATANATQQLLSNSVISNHINNNVLQLPATTCNNTTTSPNNVSNAKSQTLPPSQSNHLNNNLEKSYSSGLIGLQRRIKPPAGTAKNKQQRHSTDGSQSDGCDSAVMLRKSPKHRSPNHNRFSHQFSLCCKAERKPLTPPVTVRYNSAHNAAAAAAAAQSMKRDNLSLSWSMADNASLSLNSTDAISLMTASMPVPAAAAAANATRPINVAAASSSASAIYVCASAPQSPVTAKAMFASTDTAHSSPSNSSLKSDTFNAVGATSNGSGGGPIRPIAVTACRSRLRLKLLPPGKELPKQLPNFETAQAPVVESILKATTPQHMSSPNIASKPEVVIEQPDVGVRFMSHENIQMPKQPSGSGLARQALMAAQVLSLIPTEKARDRGYLDGRFGSSSLMGPSELDRVLPNKEVTIFVGTWNMNGQNPPKQMNDFVLPNTVEHVPDIVAIGTQESSPDRFEWEATIQETLGPSHVLFHSTTLGTLHLAIYMRRDLIWYCSAPEDASMSVRTGSAFRTKGAVAISFCLFGTSMLFVTSHLTAHQQKVKERVSDVKRIIHALDLPKNLHVRHKNKDVTQNFDNVFWCGDLNFRLGEPREKLLEWIQHTKFPLPSHLPHGYMHTDQLSSVLSDGAAFRGFMEANITFPPTYKYDPGTQHFDTSSKQRAPAYTDRILYKFRPQQGLPVMRRQSSLPSVATPTQPCVECVLYDSVPSIITSDHKPVLALFRTMIRAGTDSIPLAAGLFNRDIYLEGMKRRLNNQYTDSSAVCVLQ